MSKTRSATRDSVPRRPQLFAAATIGIALLALIGWLSGARILAGQWGKYIPMAPSTALVFLLLAAALFCFARWHSQRASRTFAVIATMIVSLLGLLVLAQFIFGIDFGVEQALSWRIELLGSTPFGRMSPLTAIAFLLESAAFFLLTVPRWRNALAAAALLAAGAIAINVVVLIGYAYGAPFLYGGLVVPTAWTAAIAFGLVGVAQIYLAVPGVPRLRAWSRDSLRGILLRAFLPFIFFIVLAQGWLEVSIQPLQSLNPALRQSLKALVAGGLIVVIIGWIARRTGAKIERAQAALRETELRLHAVLSNAPITIFATDRDGIFTLSEGKGLGAVGLKPGENVGVSAFDLYASFPFVEHAGKVTEGKDVIRRVLAGEAVTAVTELRGVYFENNIGPIRDTDGKVVGIVGVATDITERKQAEEKLRESEKKYRDLVETAHDLIWAVDAQGRITFMNQASERIYGYAPEELIGSSYLSCPTTSYTLKSDDIVHIPD